MQFSMLIEFFWAFLFSKRAGSVVRRIAWISLGALTISVSALIVVISIMTALNHSLFDRLLAVEPHLSLIGPSQNPLEIAELRNLILKVTPLDRQDLVVRTGEGRFRGVQALGMTSLGLKDLVAEVRKVAQEKKEAEIGMTDLAPGEVLLGSDLAQMLGVFEGDSISVFPPESLLLAQGEVPKFEKLKVKRIFSTYLQDYDATSLFYISGQSLLSLRKKLNDKNGAQNELQIWLKDKDQIEVAIAELRRAYPEKKIRSWKDKNAALFFSLMLEKLMIGLFLSMAACVAGFSLFIILGLLISQKRRETGLMQALGLSSRDARRLYQRLGFFLALCGVVLGSVLGSALSIYLEIFPLRILPDIYYNSELNAVWEFRFVALVLLIGGLLCWIGSQVVSRSLLGESISSLLRNRT
jgi:lipoprotein-releasing system permease protein